METLKVLKTRFHFNNVDGFIKTFGKHRNPEEVIVWCFEDELES